MQEFLHCARTVRYFWTTLPLEGSPDRPLLNALKIRPPQLLELDTAAHNVPFHKMSCKCNPK